MMTRSGLVIEASVMVGRGTPVHGWGLLGPFLLGVLLAAVGLLVVLDYRGFATWHRRRAEASVPSWLRRLSEGRAGQRREFNNRVNRVTQKLVGWWFLVGGALFAAGALIQGISDLSRGR
ncbi:hypothetical protein ACFXKC_56595 [Streptomyces sp. NPDC059340]|uniref:hypothetical protein n=1 Tax=Streptomyces sp. NPDC059340 TaxID=3346806 RepID=UPI00369D7966